MTLEEHKARINATPRCDKLAQAHLKIGADSSSAGVMADWIALAQTLERDLRDLMEAMEPPKARVYTQEEIAAKAACARVVQGQMWADGMERAAELIDEEANSARSFLSQYAHKDVGYARLEAIVDNLTTLAKTVRAFKNDGLDPLDDPNHCGHLPGERRRAVESNGREHVDCVSNETYENEFQRANENARKLIELGRELAEVKCDRDEGWKRFKEMRAIAAEAKYPGMTGEVHALDAGSAPVVQQQEAESLEEAIRRALNREGAPVRLSEAGQERLIANMNATIGPELARLRRAHRQAEANLTAMTGARDYEKAAHQRTLDYYAKLRDVPPKRRFPEPCNMDVLVEHDRYEAMMLDVCRYRWLRSEEVATNPRYYPFWQEFNAKLLRERHMDALIDAAMVEPKERSL